MDEARIKAAADGKKTFRGKPCKNPDHRGGDGKSERYVKNGGCIVCVRESASRYHRRTQAILRALSED